MPRANALEVVPEETEESPELPPVHCNHIISDNPLALGKLKTCKGTIGTNGVNILLDNGANAVFVRKSLVSDEALLGRTITVQTADTRCTRAPLARILLDCPYYRGEVTAIAMEQLTHDVLLGRVPGTTSFEEELEGPEETTPHQETAEVAHIVTRAAAKRSTVTSDGKAGITSIPQYNSVEFGNKQRECNTLEPLFAKAENGVEETHRDGRVITYVVQNGTLQRKTLQDGQETQQLVVPQTLRKQVLEVAHDNPLSGHFSQKKTQAIVEREFYWPTLNKDVVLYCHSCHVCQIHTPRRPSKAPLINTTITSTPFTAISVDLVGPLQPASARGHRFILTVVDQATRYADAAPLRHIDADTVAQALIEMCTRVGFPRTLTSDNGKQFTAATFEAFLRIMGVKHRLTPVYHAQSNGLVERFNGTLKGMLRKLAAEQPRDWDQYLPILLFAYRDAPQASTGLSPFELIYGHRVRGPLAILKEYWTTEDKGNEEDATTHQYLIGMKHKLKETCRIAKENLQTSQEKSSAYFNKKGKLRTLKPGEEVLIFLPDSPKKLLMAWRGPYTIKTRLGTYTYAVNIDGVSKMYHINLLRKYQARDSAADASESSDDEHQGDGEVEKAFAGVSLALEPVSGEEQGDNKDPGIPCSSSESTDNCSVNTQLTKHQKSDINAIFEEFKNLFTDIPGKTTAVVHEIRLKDEGNLNLQHSYPLPLALEPQLKQNIKEWLKLGIIEPSTSPYCSPLLAVRKKDGTHRFCLDCRHLNNKTEFDAEPIADIKAIFSRLSGKSIYSKIDLTSGYWQLPLHKSSRQYTAFKTRSGLFHFCVLPFGLANAPASFSRLIRQVTAGLENIEVYMDDILIATNTWTEHCTTIKKLLEALNRYGLHAKPSKCEFGYEKLEYLGHELSHNHIKPVEGRVDALQNTPLPKTKKQLRSFLGSVGYYHQFIPHYADKAAPLQNLLKKTEPEQISWTDTTQDVFESLKQSLTTEPVLQLPDINAPFILRTDASNTGISAVLLQPSKKDFRHYAPVAYASRRIRGAELNYSTIEKEALAIYWALQKFEIYLYARDFVIETDHRPLLYLQGADKLNPRLKRWALYLSLFRFKAQHIPGPDNHLADFMSRLP